MSKVVYDNAFYDQQTLGSLSSARIVLPILFEYFKPSSVIDIGCGRGAWLKGAAENGVQQILGIDGDYVDKANLLIDPKNFKPMDLRERIKFPKRFDLTISVEVAEHLPFSRSETFVADLCKLSDVVLFSAALPYQGGTDHINEQWLEFWAIHFRRNNYIPCDFLRGRILGNDSVDFWYSQNLIVFAREDIAHKLFPAESIANNRPLSFAHPFTLLANIGRHRPLFSQASDCEYHDYHEIVAAYLSGGTGLPLMKMLTARGTSDSINVDLFPSARTNMMDVHGELEARDRTIRQQTSDLDNQEHEIRSLISRISLHEDESKRTEDRIATLNGQIRDFEDELLLRKQEILAAKSQLQERIATISSLVQIVADRDAEVSRLERALTEQSTEIAGLKQTIAEQYAQINFNNQTNGEHEIEILNLKSSLTEHHAHLSRLTQVIGEQDNRIQQLKGSLSERDAHVSHLSQAIEERDRQIATLSGKLGERENSISSLLQSRSWKVTRPLRNFRQLFPKPAPKSRSLFCFVRELGVLRNSSLFDATWYLSRYPDAAAYRWGPMMHYLRHGAYEGRNPNPLFDTFLYLKNNRDVENAGLNPLAHYIQRGASEGRDPNSVFDSDWYCSQYPDVAEAGTNPLIHYIQEGAAKGRNPGPTFNTVWYLNQYPDVAGSEFNPLAHYILYGASEGRRTAPSMEFLPKSSPIEPDQNDDFLQNSLRNDKNDFAEKIGTLRNELAAEANRLSASVTVIIPCYNYGEFVQEAVASVLNQSYLRTTVIVVDDGSNDPNTLGVLETLRNSRVSICRQNNQGLSSARNNGAALAKSDYLMFLDADDRLEPEAIALMLLELEANPDRDYAYSYQRFFGDQELVWASQQYNAYDILWRNHPSVCSLIKTDRFRNSAQYRSEMLFGWEDWEHWLALSTQESFGHCIPVPLFQHRRHGTTMTETAQQKSNYLAATLRRLNESAYEPTAILQRKLKWRPSVSVVVPFYNRTEYVEETLASLARQSIEDFEIIIVDDGSDSPEALHFLSTLSDKRIRIVRRDHGGLSAARNSGVAAARSEFIYFLDSDDLLEPTALEKLAIMCLMHPDTAFFYTGVVHFGNVNGVCMDPFDRERLLRENFLTASSMIRREVYLRLGGQDESLVNNYEDYDFWLRLIESGLRGMLLPEELFKYRRHTNSLIHQHISDATHEDLIERLRSRHPALFGGPPVNRSSWKLMRPPEDERLPITAAFSDLYRMESGLPYENWRLVNLPTPFQSRYWSDNRFHILYCIPSTCIGGAERVDLDILSALPREAFHVTLVTMEISGQQWLQQFNSLVDEIFSVPHLSATSNQTAALLQYLCFSRNIDLIFNRNTIQGYVLVEAIRKITSTVAAADLLHLHDNGLDWVRASVTFHDGLDARIVISKNLQKHAATTYALPAEDFTVISNGVDLERSLTDAESEDVSRMLRLELGIPIDAPVIGFVGRFALQKDPVRWVRTADLIARQAPEVHFLMVGDGELRPLVEQTIADLNLEGRVHLTGFRDDVEGMFAVMSVLLLTSLYEGLPMVVLEAMLQGIPVVSTLTGGTDECVTDNVGVLLPADASPEQISAAVLEFLIRIKNDESIGVRCRERIRDHFSLVQMQTAYRSKFEHLCSKREIKERLEDYQKWFMTNNLPWQP